MSHVWIFPLSVKSATTSWQWQKWLILLKSYATQHSSEGLPDCHPMIKLLIDKGICFHGNTPNNRKVRSPNKINMQSLKNGHLTMRFNHWAPQNGLFDWWFVASVAILREDSRNEGISVHRCAGRGGHMSVWSAYVTVVLDDSNRQKLTVMLTELVLCGDVVSRSCFTPVTLPS